MATSIDDFFDFFPIFWANHGQILGECLMDLGMISKFLILIIKNVTIRKFCFLFCDYYWYGPKPISGTSGVSYFRVG